MQPDADAIRAQLERILASAPFCASQRLNRFLRYVVERTLAGEAGRLKEYAIGVEVFDRDERYDPRVDSIVRVEAGRLRGKLEEYYRGAGAEDAVRISVKKGSYAPVFEQQPAPQAAPERRTTMQPVRRLFIGATLALAVLAAVAAWYFMRAAIPRGALPAIAVLSITAYGADVTGSTEANALSERLTEGVTAELVRDGTFEVIPSAAAARYGDSRTTPDNVGQLLGARALLRGRVTRQGDTLRVDVMLMDSERNRKVWVETFTGTVGTLDDLQRRIAAGVVTAAATQIIAQ